MVAASGTGVEVIQRPAEVSPPVYGSIIAAWEEAVTGPNSTGPAVSSRLSRRNWKRHSPFNGTRSSRNVAACAPSPLHTAITAIA